MANEKVSDLPADASPAQADIILTVKNPFTPGTDRKVTLTNLGKALLIPAANVITSQVLSSFTNTAGTQLKGTTLNNLTLNWTYNRAPDPTSQTIDSGVGAVAVNLRTKALTSQALTSNKTYNISAVGDDGTNSSLGTTIQFLNYRYFGVSQSVLNTSAGVKAALSNEFASTVAVNKVFDASVSGGNNYLYYCYPTSFGLPSTSKIGGLDFSDYTVTTITAFDNGTGFTEDFYLLKTNTVQNGAAINWVLT